MTRSPDDATYPRARLVKRAVSYVTMVTPLILTTVPLSENWAVSSPESELEMKRKRRLESTEDKPSVKLLKLDSSVVNDAHYKECTKLFDNPEDVVQGW